MIPVFASCDRTTTITIHVDIFASEDTAVSGLFVPYLSTAINASTVQVLTFTLNVFFIKSAAFGLDLRVPKSGELWFVISIYSIYLAAQRVSEPRIPKQHHSKCCVKLTSNGEYWNRHQKSSVIFSKYKFLH